MPEPILTVGERDFYEGDFVELTLVLEAWFSRTYREVVAGRLGYCRLSGSLFVYNSDSSTKVGEALRIASAVLLKREVEVPPRPESREAVYREIDGEFLDWEERDDPEHGDDLGHFVMAAAQAEYFLRGVGECYVMDDVIRARQQILDAAVTLISSLREEL